MLYVNTVDFIDWVKSKMAQKKLSQTDIANIGGISRSAVSKLLTGGQKSPGADMFRALSLSFNVPLEVIYDKAGLPMPQSTSESSETQQREAEYLFGLLSEEEQQEALRYLRFLVNDKSREERGNASRLGNARPEAA